jgi:glycosyltransferase involved in cell wall biosynthesis
MITVMHVIDTGGPGGAETVFLEVSTRLDPSRFRSVCVVSREGWLTGSLRERGYEPLIVPSSGSVNFGYLRNLISIARAHGVDLIVAHLYGSAIYCSLAGMLARLPVVAVLHGQTDVSPSERMATLKRLAVRHGTDAVVFVSEQLRKALAPLLRMPRDRCAVIPNGVDAGRFAINADRTVREELGLAPRTVLVGAVGNIRRPKGYDVLLRAARILKDRHQDYRFVIVGEGHGSLLQELTQLRAELGLIEDVAFLGLRSDVARLLTSFDVYVLSSTTEGFSISCIEAMAAGRPVVATRSGGPDEIVEDGISGLLVPPGDADALAEAIDHLRSDQALASRLAVNGVERVRRMYTLGTMLTAYERLLESSVTNRIK